MANHNLLVPDMETVKALLTSLKDATGVNLNIFVVGEEQATKMFETLREDNVGVVVTPTQRVSDTQEYLNRRPKTWAETTAEQYPDLFPNVGVKSGYVGCGAINNTGMNVYISRNRGGFAVGMWHGGRKDTDTFRNSFTTLCQQLGLVPRLHTVRGWVDGRNTQTKTLDGAIEIYKLFIKSLEDSTVSG